MFLCLFLFLIFFIKAYIVGTHLNCNSVQFKNVATTYAYYKEVDKKVHLWKSENYRIA